MNDEALIRLGQLLTSSEAAKLAARYADGDTLTQALHGVALARRPEIRVVLEACGVVPTNLEVAIPVLRAVQGAGSRTTDISPVWTLPGHLADYGSLTTSTKDLVLSARTAVTCSTYNFQRSSSLWEALREVASRGTVQVRVYMDTEAAAGQTGPNSPSCQEVAAQLVGAFVYRTRSIDGKPVRNHAKFVAVDHQFLIVTSANFSMSAEQNNVELGLRVHSPALTQIVEDQLWDVESTVYERVE